MALSEDEITRLYRIRRTVLEMLKDRDYLVTEAEINMTKEQFKSTYGENMKREDLDINKEKRSNSSDQIYVFFPNEAKVGVNTMRDYTKRMQSQNVFRAILVSQTKLTPFANRCISEMSTRFRMEVFQEEELLVNIREHVLVPAHQVLTNEEKKSLLQRYTVKETQLPRMQVVDPVARYYRKFFSTRRVDVHGVCSEIWVVECVDSTIKTCAKHVDPRSVTNQSCCTWAVYVHGRVLKSLRGITGFHVDKL